MFEEVTRKEFREIFQPSRVVLAIVRDPQNNRFNFFPVAFNMYCGYNPLTFCFAVHDINYSYELLENSCDFTIGVPGEKMVDATMGSGLISGKEVDKFQKFGLSLFSHNEALEYYGINECIANVCCTKIGFYKVSDHAVVVGKVDKIFVDKGKKEKNILSISKHQINEYQMLLQKGIHRLAVM